MAEEDNTAESDSQVLAEVTARSKEVTALLNKREKSKALVLSLSNPPIQAKAADIKASLQFLCLKYLVHNKLL